MSPDEREIRELVNRWLAATQQGDIDAVLELMTEDVVFLVPGQPPMVGRAAFAKAARAQSLGGSSSPHFEGRSDIREIEVHGEIAFMWTHLEVAVTPLGGATLRRAGHTLSVLRKENGRWLLARDANLLVAVA